MIEQPNPLSLTRQCQLLGLSRAALYYRPVEVSDYELEVMALIDRQYLHTPFYGSRRMTAWLQTQGHLVNRKRVQRLMGLMGLEAIYQRPHTSRPAPGNRTYAYLLRGLVIERVNQMWAADITYIPIVCGILCLVAMIDWVGRYVLAWGL
ncbi:MAG: transposase [Deltaproteobacteria bacterium]|nr:transposase [Deltaproteobacteria bacterium]